MKKIITLITLCIFVAGSVLAATDSADLEKKKIEEIKKKITEQTEKTKESLERVVSGIIEKKEENTFVLDNQEVIELDSELTRYYEVKGNQIVDREKENFEEGDYIFALGPILDEKFNVLEVYKDEKFNIEFGVVTEVDSKGNFIRFLNTTKKEVTANINRKTKLLLLTDEEKFDFENVRISKLKEGDYIALVYKVEQEGEEINASKILIIPQELIEKFHSEKVN